MNRIYSIFIICLLFTSIGNAQYTSIINSNTPGHTQTPFAVGTNVYQAENTFSFNNFKEKSIKSKSASNNLNIRVGVWKEKLEASLIHRLVNDYTKKTNGTDFLAIGAKYLVYNPKPKEDEQLKRSWKRTHGFRIENLIPSVAVSAHYNTPVGNSKLSDHKSSFSVAAIAQNQITSKIRVNNQLEYNYIGSDSAEIIYSISASHVFYRRFNPYFEFRYHSLSQKDNPNYLGYTDIGIGTPFLVNRDLSIAIQYNQIIGDDFSGSQFGLNIAYRLDKHYDRWIKKKTPKEFEEEQVVEGVATKEGTSAKSTKKTKAQEAEYLDSILDPKKREKARKKADKAAAKAEKKAAKEAEKEEKRIQKEKENPEKHLEKLNKKQEKADKKAAKKEAKRKKKEEKQKAKEKKDSFVDDFLLGY